MAIGLRRTRLDAPSFIEHSPPGQNRALNALTRAIARVAIRGVARMAPRVYILTFMSYPLARFLPLERPPRALPGTT